VAELERLVAEAPPGHDGAGFVAWPLNPLTGAVRELVMQLVFFPAYHLLWRIRVVGREGLRDLDGPIILAANHNFGVGTVGLDPVAAWMGLPRHLRLRISTAGEEHAVFSHPLKAFIARLCNTFPLSQEGNVRASLELVGRMLDRGWSVLIFPEGKLTVGGPIQPFKGGTGMLAVEARAAVVPLRIDLERPSVLEGGRWLSRGAFTVRVGDPLILAPGTPVALATQRIEEAVRSL
jgi:long-chain acyl-CoA synthetase